MGRQRFGRQLAIAALLLVLPSCQTATEQAASDDASCTAMGVSQGSQEYGSCRIALVQKRTAESQERSQRLYNIGTILAGPGTGRNAAEAGSAGGLTCFKRSEQTSGFNKICYYDCLGSLKAVNLGSTELCPLTASP